MMTREEAIELVCYGDWLNILMLHLGDDDINRLAEAMCIIGNALRPVSREQVAKLSRCEHCKDGKSFDGQVVIMGNKGMFPLNFCPWCGSPLKDEAVQMVMERLEALHETVE